MKKFIYILVSMVACYGQLQAQTGLYNSGNIQMHPDSKIGFHTNFINDSAFDQTVGLAGFYGNNTLQVSGSIPPTLWDAEFFVTNDVFLSSTVNVRNNTSFVDGNVLSPKDNPAIYLNFMDTGFYSGDRNQAKVTGFAAINNRDFFVFPVGDEEQLRPLTLQSEGNTPLAACAYFFESPSNPLSLAQGFNVSEKIQDIGTVTDREFWIVQSNAPASITIGWNQRSDLASIPNATFESIIIVGWSKAASQWVIIGNAAKGGDLSNGIITSEVFNPNDYAAVTFGTIPLPTDTFAVNNPTLGNYFLSPNGDGVNDVLVFDNIDESPNNSVLIFNRFGQKVYEKVNYANDFNGLSNTGNFYLSQDIGLPEGFYYYLVTLDDLNLEYQGFLFLDR